MTGEQILGLGLFALLIAVVVYGFRQGFTNKPHDNPDNRPPLPPPGDHP